jgi:DtxR family Mn-dependent transcriptional regulator
MPSPQFLLGATAAIIVSLSLLLWPRQGLLARFRAARDHARRVRTEDALKHLFSLEMDGRRPTLQSVAGAVGASPDTAAGLLTEMAAGGLVELAQARIGLSARGRDYAIRVVRAHRLWERHLAEHTGYAEVDWHRIAERHEHRLTPEAADALAQSLGNPAFDPHGDPIPTASGELAATGGAPLSGLRPGDRARIVHLEDEPAVIYSQLVAEGLHPGMVLSVLGVDGERIRFWAGGEEHVLAPLLSNHVTVAVLQPEADLPEPGIPLTQLAQGQSATIVALSPGIRGAERRRLLDLGFLPGTRLIAELRSPSGDPTGYIVRETLIALRADQARHIRVQP